MAERARSRTVTRWTTFSLCAAIGAVVGCSSNSNANTNDDSGTLITCQNDPRAQAFKTNVATPGDMHALSFEIVSATFAPPARANNTWTLKVLDANGQPAQDVALTFPKGVHPSDPWMPDHQNHGATPAQATKNADGTFTVTPLDFFMGGIWSTLIQATSGSVTDTITLTYCIPS